MKIDEATFEMAQDLLYILAETVEGERFALVKKLLHGHLKDFTKNQFTYNEALLAGDMLCSYALCQMAQANSVTPEKAIQGWALSLMMRYNLLPMEALRVEPGQGHDSEGQSVGCNQEQ